MKKKLKLYSRDWKRNSMQLYILKENKPYKRNMFALLKKPGYEKETEAIFKRLEEE